MKYVYHSEEEMLGRTIEAQPNARQVGGDHYKKLDIQPWDIIDQGPSEQAIGFYRYNALKYLIRAGDKGGFLEDIQKAEHYIQKLISIMKKPTEQE